MSDLLDAPATSRKRHTGCAGCVALLGVVALSWALLALVLALLP